MEYWSTDIDHGLSQGALEDHRGGDQSSISMLVVGITRAGTHVLGFREWKEVESLVSFHASYKFPWEPYPVPLLV